MTAIKISDLNSAGSTLLMDSESYLNELTNDEVNINGGAFSYANFGFSVSQGQSVSYTGFSVSRGRGVSIRFW